jgi:CRISPR-associated protein Cst2
MSMHIFGAVLTAHGIAANNRGESEGNISTLQKLLWKGQVHTTVSAEAIRWAIRYYWQIKDIPVNRVWNDEIQDHEWQDVNWAGWKKKTGKTYIDDDVLGFMKAEAGKTEGVKGTADKRRGCLEIARAISTTPFAGDITFNAKSGEKGRTSLYGTEVHSTRYQYGFALTPEQLRVKSRALDVIDAIVNLGEVAGNHSRFLFDFSPESIVLRITDDPAPRFLYCFEEDDKTSVTAPELVQKIEVGDIDPSEIYIGGRIAQDPSISELEHVKVFSGIKELAKEFGKEMNALLSID